MWCVYRRDTYLAPIENGPEAVEELERREDMALHQHARAQGRRHPPPRAHGHLKEPLLERESSHHAVTARKHVGHGGMLGVGAERVMLERLSID
jgi:hypothetical protein